MVKTNRYLRARAEGTGVKTPKSHRPRGGPGADDRGTKSPARLEGWGEKEATVDDGCREHLGFFIILKKKKKTGQWRGEGCEESKNTEETSTLKGPSGIGG